MITTGAPTSCHTAAACSTSGGRTSTTWRPRCSAALASSNVTRSSVVKGREHGSFRATERQRHRENAAESVAHDDPGLGIRPLPEPPSPRDVRHHRDLPGSQAAQGGRGGCDRPGGGGARLPHAADRSGCRRARDPRRQDRSEEHTSELQSRLHLVCRLLLEKKKKKI